MQIFLGLIGLVVAAAIWNAGHPFLAVIVGFLLVGGAGWMLPIWIAKGVSTSRVVRSGGRSRAGEMRHAWQVRGYPGEPPISVLTMYTRERAWTSADEVLDIVVPTLDRAVAIQAAEGT